MMDRSKLEAANELAAKIDHYKWISTELITRKNADKQPIRMFTGVELQTVAAIDKEDLKELTVVITQFLRDKIKGLEKDFEKL